MLPLQSVQFVATAHRWYKAFYLCFAKTAYMKKLFAILIMLNLTGTVAAQSNGRYANVNGLKMYYEVHGDGFPLVLIHGGGSTIGTTFGRILPVLAKTHKIIAVEMQAHGHTADIDRPLSFDQD